MTDPIMVTIATALVDKAAEAVVTGGRNALVALGKLVRRRFAKEPAATVALEAAEARPADETRIRALAAALQNAADADPEFAVQLRALWAQATTELTADRDGVINQFSGTAEGPVIQARDISGGISFGNPQPRQES